MSKELVISLIYWNKGYIEMQRSGKKFSINRGIPVNSLAVWKKVKTSILFSGFYPCLHLDSMTFSHLKIKFEIFKDWDELGDSENLGKLLKMFDLPKLLTVFLDLIWKICLSGHWNIRCNWKRSERFDIEKLPSTKLFIPRRIKKVKRILEFQCQKPAARVSIPIQGGPCKES